MNNRVMRDDEILDAFRQKMMPVFGAFTSYTMEYLSLSLINNICLVRHAKNIRATGDIYNRRVTATLTMWDTRNPREFTARYLLIFTSKKGYKASINYLGHPCAAMRNRS